MVSFSCKLQENKNKTDVNNFDTLEVSTNAALPGYDSTGIPGKEYDFDTTLKGGYSIVYKTDDSLQYLFLKKGDFCKQISVDEKENSTQLLGFKLADFDDYFVLGHNLHIWQPEDQTEFELIEKKTGNIIIHASYIDADEKNSLILYYNATRESFSDSMKLFNIVTKTTESFAVPMDDKEDTRLINKIRIKKISPKYFTVSFFPNIDSGKEIEKKYKR